MLSDYSALDKETDLQTNITIHYQAQHTFKDQEEYNKMMVRSVHSQNNPVN